MILNKGRLFVVARRNFESQVVFPFEQVGPGGLELAGTVIGNGAFVTLGTDYSCHFLLPSFYH